MSAKLRDDPIPYSSGYSLDLYCKYADCAQHTRAFTGRTFTDCARTARRVGWLIHRDGLCTCPQHNTKRSTT